MNTFQASARGSAMRIACARSLARASLGLFLLGCASTDRGTPLPESVSSTAESIVEGPDASFLESGNPDAGVSDDIWAVSDVAIHKDSPSVPDATSQTITLSNYSSSNPNYGYVRFVVDNLTAAPTQALLILYIEEGEAASTAEGLKVRVSSDAWDAYNLTYDTALPASGTPAALNAPAFGSVIADFTNKPIPDGLFGTGATVGQSGFQAIDVTSVVKGNGVYSFRLAWHSSTGSGRSIRFRTQDFRVPGSSNDLNHQCNGLPCVRLQVTGKRNPRSSACPSVPTAPARNGNLPSSLNGCSGFVESAKFNGFFYVNNDHPASPGSFTLLGPVPTPVTDTIGTRRTYNLPSGFYTSEYDGEDIQIGPGPKLNTSYVYLGDIGDNGHARSSFKIFRMEEPASLPAPNSSTVSATGDTLLLKYPLDFYGDGQQMKLNSEAFFIDPVTGNLYVIEKPCGGVGITGYNRIFSLTAPLPFGDGVVHELSDTTHGIDMRGFPGTADDGMSCNDQKTSTAGQRSTGATINRTGTAVAVTFYGKTMFWWLQYRGNPYYASGEPAWTMAINAPQQYGWQCDVSATSNDVGETNKREAIGFSRDTPNSGVHFWTAGEGSGHAIWKY